MSQKPMGVDDLVTYGAAGAAIIATYLGLQALELHRFVCLIGALVAGAAVGWIAEQVWNRMKSRPRGPEDRGLR